MDDELFAARALDVQDVGRRVLRILLGLPDTALSAVTEPSIIVAEDLTPSDTASLDPVPDPRFHYRPGRTHLAQRDPGAHAGSACDCRHGADGCLINLQWRHDHRDGWSHGRNDS
jgi:hypothetical protein